MLAILLTCWHITNCLNKIHSEMLKADQYEYQWCDKWR